jgi:hypothetical protein
MKREDLPPRFNRATEREIACVVSFRNFDRSVKAIRRPLTEEERSLLKTRIAELEQAVATVPTADPDMLLGVLPTGMDDETATGMMAQITESLGAQPPWAVREACLRIRQTLERRREGETLENMVNRVVRELTWEFERALRECRGILEAPVEADRPLQQAPRKVVDRIGDGKHTQRVLADLEARKNRQKEL